MSTWLDERAAIGDEVTFTGPNGCFFLRESESPAAAARRRHRPRADPGHPAEARDCGSTRSAHLVYGVEHRRRPRRARAARAARRASPNFTWDHCVSHPATRRPNTGLRDEPDQARAPPRRRRRGLPLRPAADGRVRTHHFADRASYRPASTTRSSRSPDGAGHPLEPVEQAVDAGARGRARAGACPGRAGRRTGRTVAGQVAFPVRRARSAVHVAPPNDPAPESCQRRALVAGQRLPGARRRRQVAGAVRRRSEPLPTPSANGRGPGDVAAPRKSTPLVERRQPNDDSVRRLPDRRGAPLRPHASDAIFEVLTAL